MQRTIVASADPGAAALDELKQWLAIGSSNEDALLEALLRSALDICESFIGAMPLAATCEEMLAASTEWQRLATRPVQAIASAEGVPADGPRFALAADAWEVDLDAEGAGLVRLLRQGSAGRVAVRFTAGMAADWNALPEGLRHGVIRLAAHHYRERDGEAQAAPPAAVAALWRPWRRLRLT